MEVFISGNGDLLPSGALPPDLLAVASSNDVQFADTSVSFSDDMNFSSYSGSFTDQDLALISTQGTVLTYEINATGGVSDSGLSCFDSAGDSEYVARFSYDTSAIGIPSGLNETSYPLISFSIVFDDIEFLALPTALITIKNNAGQDFVKFSSGLDIGSFITDADTLQMEVLYDTTAMGTPVDASTTQYPILDFTVRTSTQSFAVLTGSFLSVKNNAGQDVVKFMAPLKLSPPATSAWAELTIAGSGSLIPAGTPPPDLLAVLASPEVQFTVARISFQDSAGNFVDFAGSFTLDEMMDQISIFMDGFENDSSQD
jgi:hypothetical protein